MIQLQTTNSILLLNGGYTNIVTIDSYEDNPTNKVFWVYTSLEGFTERVPIWNGIIYEQNIANWNMDLLVKSVKAFYENDRGIVPIVYQDTSSQNWDMFNLTMMSNPRFNQVYATCSAVAPLVGAALPTALDQVTTKGTTLFNLVFNQICSLGGATAEDRLVWGAIAQDNNLPQDFIDILKG